MGTCTCSLPFAATLVVALSGCQAPPPADVEAERTAVAQAIDGTIEWAKTKDFERLYGIIADDSAYLEVSRSPRIGS